MDDNNKIIQELLKEVRDDIKEVAKNANEHREQTAVWQATTSGRLELIEVDLREHKEGVINNRELIRISNKRLEIVEEPYKALNIIKKAAIWITAIASAVLVLAKIKGLI